MTTIQISPLSLKPADLQTFPSLTEAQMAALTSELDAAPLIMPDALPQSGTFWSLQNPTWPPLPSNTSHVPVWMMDDGNAYLLNDVDFDYDARPQTGRRMMSMGVPDFDDTGDGGTNEFVSYSMSIADYGTNLWIADVVVTNGYLAGVGSNTLSDVQYEIQSRTNLAQSDWRSEGFILGSETNNWTPLNVSQGNRTNLFIRLRSWIDSDNVGIPDWWQQEYFGYVGINPYASSPSGDGFSIWHKYQNGLNPNSFETPPAPNNFVAVLSTNGTDVLLSWNAAQGTVTNYSIVRGNFNYTNYVYDYSTIATVNASTTSFLNARAIQSGDDPGDFNYRLTANYPGSHTSGTALSGIYYTAPPPPGPQAAPGYNIYVSATLIRNETGRWQLMFAGLSSNVQTIRLYWNSTTQDISPSVLTNGIYHIPDYDVVNYLGDYLSVQGLGMNGEPGQVVSVGVAPNDAPYFVDGRQHMKQNLNFLLRAASLHQPFGAFIDRRLNQSATNFEEFSFLHRDTDEYYNPLITMDNLWPFTMNYELANYLVDLARTNNPYGNTNFDYTINFADNIPAPPILSASPYGILQPGFFPIPQYTFGYPQLPNNSGSPWGVTLSSTQTVASLQSGLFNVFGLPYEDGIEIDFNSFTQYGVLFTWISDTTPIYYQLLSPGSSVTSQQPGYHVGAYASGCQAPTLLPVNYYFAPLINPYENIAYLPSVTHQPFPLPIDDSFNITNQTPSVIIGSIGQPIIIGSWAKYAISNSSPTKYAYLGQYFTNNAFMLGTNGVATTNSAGALSPYGEFFPTQGGQAQLITMPDINTGVQGTCTVSIVSLNLDANHDGTMDLSYYGQDQTSPSKPYVFWCNNNFDRWATYVNALFTETEQDDMQSGNSPYTPYIPTMDCNYLDIGANRVIPCARDLEDFSRLWISGVTSNLLAALPSGSTVTLSWDSVSDGSPAIDLFQAADADGGIGYLTNSAVATNQINPTYSGYVGRIEAGQAIQLNSNFFGNTWRGNHFIWCGVANGSGQLTLSFKDANGNVLGQASVYIQIQDIKQMYERWTVGDISSQSPATTALPSQNGLVGSQTSFQYGPATTNTPYILLVHGYNMKIWEKDTYAQTAFKRLYWQGYQGRFGAFNWPTAPNAVQFGASELQAWNSAPGLLNKLNDLNVRYPGQVYLLAHSLGNVVAGEALRLASSSHVVNTYVAMQGAVAAHAYDSTRPTRTLSNDYGTLNCYAHYWTNGAPCYFNGSAGAETYVNFYNTNDWALRVAWLTFENTKPNLFPSYSYTSTGLYYKNYDITRLFFPGDTYELFTSLIQARCNALGMQPDVGGVFAAGDQVDLQSVWPPDTYPSGNYKDHVWHSAEFRSDTANRWGFWNAVLGTHGFNLK